MKIQQLFHTRKNRFHWKRFNISLRWGLLMLFVLLLAWIFVPRSYENNAKSMCHVESKCLQRIISSGGDTLYYRPDSLALVDRVLFLKEDSAYLHLRSVGFFVSNGGHIISSNMVSTSAFLKNDNFLLRQQLSRYFTALTALKEKIALSLKKFEYYARTHTSIDDGYTRAMELQDLVLEKQKRISTLCDMVERMLKSKHLFLSTERDFWITTTTYKNGKVVCKEYPALCVGQSKQQKFLLLQLRQQQLPDDAQRFVVYRYSPMVWNAYSAPHLTCGYPDWKPSALADVAYIHSYLPYFVGFSPTINSCGQLIAAQHNGHTVDISQFSNLYYHYKNYLSWMSYNLWKKVCGWWSKDTPSRTYTLALTSPIRQNIKGGYSLAQYYQVKTKDKNTYAGQMFRQKPNGMGTMYYGDGKVYHGEWKNGQRQGEGRLTTMTAHYDGLWNNDTLVKGTAYYDDGKIYSGQFNADNLPSGEGRMIYTDYLKVNADDSLLTYHEYYEGEWAKGIRDGFGIGIYPYTNIKVGVWKNNRYLGEHMIYSPHRVYGIDISKFQHESGKKRFSIHWKDLKITGLGKLERRIVGKIDYPVDFVYIKATEGLTVKSTYYKKDAMQARRHGIQTGAYHFFSTTTPGTQQAFAFLKYAKLQKGDLAPMLDVEPSEQQIKRMGGEQRLFEEMLNWLNIVEKRCGVIPVLYISQMFVNNHMVHAPKALLRYPVWIARYSQYKPYVKLRYWQLTPYGQVRGIHGEVDINVFNGSHEQFKEMTLRDNIP